MGEDIHQLTYLKHRKTGKYINAHEVCDWCPSEGSLFEEIVPCRNYNLFSLFGSNRGEYAPLADAEYGMPEFLCDTVFDEYCMNACYYGFTWFKLPKFSKSVKEYIKTLKDPLKYLDEDTDEHADWVDLISYVKAGKEDWYEKFTKSYEEWLDYHKNILSDLKRIDETLDRFVKIDDWCGTYNKIFDINETVFLFFFDN